MAVMPWIACERRRISLSQAMPWRKTLFISIYLIHKTLLLVFKTLHKIHTYSDLADELLLLLLNYFLRFILVSSLKYVLNVIIKLIITKINLLGKH